MEVGFARYIQQDVWYLLDQAIVVALRNLNFEAGICADDELLEFIEAVDDVVQLVLLESPAPSLDCVQKSLDWII